MVTCLMVTLPVSQRFSYLQRSLAAYCRQTHRDKELVLVLDRGPADAKSAIAAYVASLNRDDIRIVDPAGMNSLGALRNISRESARGDILCQWDDDDWHHPQRLERQLAALVESGGQSVVLQEVMQFFPESRSLYCTNWRSTPAQGLPGTLMCRQSAPIHYPETGYGSQLGEDSAVSTQLQQQDGYHVLADAPHLYVYVSHGDNSWPDEHHQMLAAKLGISRALLLRREARLREGLRPYDFGSDDVTVHGYNGAAFTLGGSSARRTAI
jgi:glycosyltransferase involved in cell wall biosynthesis